MKLCLKIDFELELRSKLNAFLRMSAGFLKYRTATTRRPEHQHFNKKKPVPNNYNSVKSDENDLDTSGFASETTEREQKSLEDYKMATANAVISNTPEIVIESDMENLSLHSQTSSLKSPHTTDSGETQNGPSVNGSLPPTNSSLFPSSSSSGTSSMTTSPRHVQDKLRVSVEVMRTATERHQKGLMSPLIYHMLVGNEVRLPVIMEDDQHKEFPPAHLIYRPIRQKVYAVIFNLHHLCYLTNKTRQETA